MNHGDNDPHTGLHGPSSEPSATHDPEEMLTADQDLAAQLEALRRDDAELRNLMASEEQQRLLVAELNHRVRNMLQVVIGLAHQTLRRAQSLQDFEQSFMGRILALARAYELLSNERCNNVPMSQLLATQLGPFANEGRRYTGNGEHVVIASSAALSLGLVLYELATNATKYGALSTAEGRVDVSWRLATGEDGRDEFLLLWRESGGPPVHPPDRCGFGTELVQRQLHYELNGTASMDFEPDGLCVTLAIPAQYVVVEGRSLK